LRAGDVLRVSCPFTPARVTDLSPEYVVVRWPWWDVDPDCDWVKWNGEVALPTGSASSEWDHDLFRVRPEAQRFAIGATCLVGIPPSVVHVIAVDRFDPPLETGRLPRPRRLVTVLRAGLSYNGELEEQGCQLDPDDDIPASFELLLRPYAFLRTGDEVADATGRAWRFDTPWDWCSFDGGTPDEPTWPLTLLTRGCRGDTSAAESVAAATMVGTHQQEVVRWAALTRARPARLS